MQVWSRFLNSDEGKRGMQYLRLACPKKDFKSDDDLIRNSVGFEFWQECLNAVDGLGFIPDKPERETEDRLDP